MNVRDGWMDEMSGWDKRGAFMEEMSEWDERDGWTKRVDGMRSMDTQMRLMGWLDGWMNGSKEGWMGWL